ncbi:unnamed protein product [Sphagnum jensenii]|uniref:Uncharacterized protein n=1 Tax=Sphagnum jensenii TaxID=128206 RepID=A0ABP0WTM3_9BRYO
MARPRIGSLCLLMCVVMLAGVPLYQKFWTTQSSLMRAQRNKGHFEKMWASSMDEAADWRKKYDDENGKVLEILQRLAAVEQQLQNCTLDRKAAESEKRTLLEENAHLQEEITRLKRGLE